MLRHCFQAVALAIFAYQMILAVNKYTIFSSVPTEESIEIADAKLPDIYYCLKALRNKRILKQHGYKGNAYFWSGRPYEARESLSVTWEGVNNLTYGNITGKKKLSFQY